MARRDRLSDASRPADSRSDGSEGSFAIGLGRAFVGAMIFGLPIMLTSEMWTLGFSIDPLRLALLLGATVPLLVRLSRSGGFRRTASLGDDIADALVAVLVAAAASAAVLALTGVVSLDRSWHENLGIVAVQIVPASIGAMLAQNQLGERDERDDEEVYEATWSGEIFLMVVGAMFLAFNLAPTGEIVTITLQLGGLQLAVLALVSLALMHAIVYALSFSGSEHPHPSEGFWSVFARFTLAGYAAVLLTAAYVLWTFGRFDGLSLADGIGMVVVLGLPGAIGAGVARLVL